MLGRDVSCIFVTPIGQKKEQCILFGHKEVEKRKTSYWPLYNAIKLYKTEENRCSIKRVLRMIERWTFSTCRILALFSCFHDLHGIENLESELASYYGNNKKTIQFTNWIHLVHLTIDEADIWYFRHGRGLDIRLIAHIIWNTNYSENNDIHNKGNYEGSTGIHNYLYS